MTAENNAGTIHRQDSKLKGSQGHDDKVTAEQDSRATQRQEVKVTTEQDVRTSQRQDATVTAEEIARKNRDRMPVSQ